MPRQKERRAGDWTCPSCSARVFANKTSCYRCKKSRPATPSAPGTQHGGKVRRRSAGSATQSFAETRCSPVIRTAGVEYCEIDGSVLEGGGQVMRLTVALSAMLGVPLLISNIRAGRRVPGLQAQHLTGVELVAMMCCAKLLGGEKLSTSIIFEPTTLPQGGKLEANTKTAGSVMLLLQIALPCAFFATASHTQFELIGGTNAIQAPPVDFFCGVLQPILEHQAGLPAPLKVSLERRGFFPQGGGKVVVTVPSLASGQALRPIQLLVRGKILRVEGIACTAKDVSATEANVMVSTASTALRQISELENIPIAIETTCEHSFSSGGGLTLWAVTDSGARLSGTGLIDIKRMTEPGKEAAMLAVKTLAVELAHGGAVDEYLQDQLLIFMALAAGESAMLCGPLSLHTKTAIHFASLVTERRAKFVLQPVRPPAAAKMPMQSESAPISVADWAAYFGSEEGQTAFPGPNESSTLGGSVLTVVCCTGIGYCRPLDNAMPATQPSAECTAVTENSRRADPAHRVGRSEHDGKGAETTL